jgi:hypothetical protein
VYDERYKVVNGQVAQSLPKEEGRGQQVEKMLYLLLCKLSRDRQLQGPEEGPSQ